MAWASLHSVLGPCLAKEGKENPSGEIQAPTSSVLLSPWAEDSSPEEATEPQDRELSKPGVSPWRRTGALEASSAILGESQFEFKSSDDPFIRSHPRVNLAI